jgi:hypothetical protein
LSLVDCERDTSENYMALLPALAARDVRLIDEKSHAAFPP